MRALRARCFINVPFAGYSGVLRTLEQFLGLRWWPDEVRGTVEPGDGNRWSACN